MTSGAAPGEFLAEDPWNGALPAGWPTVRLSQLADFVTGRTPDKSNAEYWHDGTIPWVSPRDVKSEFVSGSADRVTDLAVREGVAQLVPAGCVLVVVRSMILTHSLPVAVTTNEVAINQDIRALVCRPQIRPDFLRAVLASQEQWLIAHGYSAASGPGALSVGMLQRLAIPCPPLEVQGDVMARIRRGTRNLDALISLKEKELRLLAERKDAIIASAVAGRSWPMATEAREVPGNWEVRRLGDLGRIATGATPARGDARNWTDGTMPWLTSTVVNDGEVTSSREHVTVAALEKYRLPILQPGAVLVAATGQGRTRGLAAVLSIEAAISQHLVSIQPDPAKLDARFLRWVLFTAYDFLRGISDDGGGSRGALTREQVANLRVPLPPFAEQRSIAEHIARETAHIDRIALAAENTIEYLRERRSALLAAAITEQIDEYGI